MAGTSSTKPSIKIPPGNSIFKLRESFLLESTLNLYSTAFASHTASVNLNAAFMRTTHFANNLTMLSIVKSVQECDATVYNSSNIADFQKNQVLY